LLKKVTFRRSVAADAAAVAGQCLTAISREQDGQRNREQEQHEDGERSARERGDRIKSWRRQARALVGENVGLTVGVAVAVYVGVAVAVGRVKRWPKTPHSEPSWPKLFQVTTKSPLAFAAIDRKSVWSSMVWVLT
jgi:hypothetical protein